MMRPRGYPGSTPRFLCIEGERLDGTGSIDMLIVDLASVVARAEGGPPTDRSQKLLLESGHTIEFSVEDDEDGRALLDQIGTQWQIQRGNRS